MSAVSIFVNKAPGTSPWLDFLRAALTELEGDVAALVSGGLTDNLVFAAETQSSSDNIALTAGDPEIQVITITAPDKHVSLPDCTGLVEGEPRAIRNAGSIAFAVWDHENTVLVDALEPGSTLRYELLDGTDSAGGGTWNLSVVADRSARVVTTGGTYGDYTATTYPAAAAYFDGMELAVKANEDFLAEASLDRDSLGPKPIYRADGITQIDDGDITVNSIHRLFYNADVGPSGGWVMQQPGAASLSAAYYRYFDSTTAAGTFTANAWQTRVLDEEAFDPDGIGSLSSNQVTLAAGTYLAFGMGQAFDVDYHTLRLRDVSNNVTLARGPTVNSDSTDNEQQQATLVGVFTLAVAAAVELQHWCQTTKASNGFGHVGEATDEDNLFADLLFVKIA